VRVRGDKVKRAAAWRRACSAGEHRRAAAASGRGSGATL